MKEQQIQDQATAKRFFQQLARNSKVFTSIEVGREKRQAEKTRRVKFMQYQHANTESQKQRNQTLTKFVQHKMSAQDYIQLMVSQRRQQLQVGLHLMNPSRLII